MSQCCPCSLFISYDCSLHLRRVHTHTLSHTHTHKAIQSNEKPDLFLVSAVCVFVSVCLQFEKPAGQNHAQKDKQTHTQYFMLEIILLFKIQLV